MPRCTWGMLSNMLPSIGLFSQFLCHPSVLAHTSFLLPKEVWLRYLLRYCLTFAKEHWFLSSHQLTDFHTMLPTAGSAKSRVSTIQKGEKSTVDIGQGSLKVTFSSETGGITHYDNKKSKVCGRKSFLGLVRHLSLSFPPPVSISHLSFI